MRRQHQVPQKLTAGHPGISPIRTCVKILTVRFAWPDGKAACQRCDSQETYYVKTRRIWQCKGCKRQFFVIVGTIFERSPIGIDKWLTAVWLLTSSLERHQFL